MVNCFYVEVETDETNPNAPSGHDIMELVRGELVGPAPEDYGITRVRVGNTQWTEATGTVKVAGGYVGEELLAAAKAALAYNTAAIWCRLRKAVEHAEVRS